MQRPAAMPVGRDAFWPAAGVPVCMVVFLIRARVSVMWLQKRMWQAELLDNPGLEEAEVQKALAGLRRLNLVSRSAGILWAEIWRLAIAKGLQRLRILDIAAGGGDTLLTLLQKARRKGLHLAIGAGDINPSSLAYARGRAAQRDEHIFFFRHDALSDALPSGYDVVMCSLFLHHLQEGEAVALLQRMAGAAKHLVLINDLRRSVFNYALVWLGSRLLSRSPMVHADGPLSVRKAFTLAELSDLAGRAGLKNAEIHARFPARMLLVWRKT